MSADNQMEFFEVGDKTSLICADANVAEVVRNTLRELGYKFHIADTSDLAIERTRYTAYDIIVVQENFGSGTLSSNPVLNYFCSLAMSQRRVSMLVLVGTAFKTLDAMQAFAHSVHLVVNISDLRNLTAILKKSRAEFDNLYRVYRAALATIGEAG